MKNFLLFIFLYSSYSAFADKWHKISHDNDGMTYYVDVDTIKKEDNFVYYRNLIDFSEPTKTGILSNIHTFKVDCVREKQIWLSNTFYSQSMATGKIITNGVPVWNHYGSTLNEIRSLTPNSIEHTIMKFICDKAN